MVRKVTISLTKERLKKLDDYAEIAFPGKNRGNRSLAVSELIDKHVPTID